MERIITLVAVGRDGVNQVAAVRLRVVLPGDHRLIDGVRRPGPQGLHLLVGQIKRVVEIERIAEEVSATPPMNP